VTAPFRRKVLGATLALLGLNGVVFVLYTLPKLLEERNLFARDQALQGALAREEMMALALRRRAEVAEANERDVSRLTRELLSDSKVSLLPTLRYVETNAEEAGLHFSQRSYEPEVVKGAPFVRVGIRMSLGGLYDQIVEFLSRLEKAPQFITIDQVQLRSDAEKGQGQLSLVLSAYFLAGKEALGR